MAAPVPPPRRRHVPGRVSGWGWPASARADNQIRALRWRMLQVGDRFASSGGPVSAIAQSLGDTSESAFSTAFKRVTGCPRRRYGGERDAGSPGRPEAVAA